MKELLYLPELASQHGGDVDKLIIYVHYLMGALFVGWIIYFGYVLFRFRSSRNPKADHVGIRGHASNYIELAVAGIEAVLLIFFAIPLWSKAVDQFPKESESTVVHVIAEQFGWNVRYAGPDGKFGPQEFMYVTADNKFGLDKNHPDAKDDIQTLNLIHMPVNKPAIVYLTSRDVIHSFKVIAFRVTQDAIPGMRIPTHFTPTKVGKYQINCAQLCGIGHYSMSLGMIHVDTAEEYDKWMATQASGGGAATTFE